MFEDILSLLEKGGYGFADYKKNPRALTSRSDCGSLSILFVRSTDVIAYVEFGGADAGVVGRDQIEEQNREVISPLNLNIGYCRLVVARPEENRPMGEEKRALRIATKYPRITETHFLARGIPVSILKLYGSLELAPRTGLADWIVDLVATGRTLRENRLEIEEEILPSTARFIVNPSSWATRNEAVRTLIDRIRPHVPESPVISG